MDKMQRPLFFALTLLGFVLAGVFMSQAAPDDEPEEDFKIERNDHKKDKKPTLRFLNENKDFLRAQLDLLRRIARDRDGEAEILSDRDLMFRDMLSDILAAQDTVAIERAKMEQWELMQSVTELGELEAQMDLMAKLLDEQQQRLALLEDDFVGRQETAIVLLIKGFPADGPAALVFGQAENGRLTVPLTEAQRASLAQGGIAQIFHEFVEPRELSWDLTFEGEGWSDRPAQTLTVTPARDRMTFVQLDLEQLEATSNLALATTTWER